MSSIELLELVNDARTEFGESVIRHSDFAIKCRDELDGEYYGISVVKNSRGPATEAILMTVDQCKLVAMRESKGVRRRVLARLNKLEAQVAQSAPALPDFTSPAAAARAWAEQFEQAQAANQQLALAAPKVEFVDRYVEATGLKGFREVAKLLKANEARFREFLRDHGVMYLLGGEWTARSQHIDAGRFEIKAGKSKHSEHAFNRSMFTPKGVEWIAGEWAKYQLNRGAA
ncbi:MAG: phage antirepressor KilAC domain-containing protein [Burkholderiaceae bacterium]|nr:phage antirepressor KilAC domain-containing protein [Burkholderiaceae bacterium]